jgi:hypothetical protein
MTSVAIGGGRPAEPWCRPTSKLTDGPSGLPILTVVPSVMSTCGTRRPCTYIPFSEPLSTAVHRPPEIVGSNRSSTWARDTSGCAMRTSARRSRPMTTSCPAEKVRGGPSYRTVSAGPE